MLSLTIADLSKGFPLSDTLIISLIGFGIVFAVLVVLILTIKLITFVSSRLEPAVAEALPAAAAAAPITASVSANPNAGKVPAPGSLGECDLHNVDDRTAALLMAIVADNLQAPLNELRFLSIKELGEVKKS